MFYDCSSYQSWCGGYAASIESAMLNWNHHFFEKVMGDRGIFFNQSPFMTLCRLCLFFSQVYKSPSSLWHLFLHFLSFLFSHRFSLRGVIVLVRFSGLQGFVLTQRTENLISVFLTFQTIFAIFRMKNTIFNAPRSSVSILNVCFISPNVPQQKKPWIKLGMRHFKSDNDTYEDRVDGKLGVHNDHSQLAQVPQVLLWLRNQIKSGEKWRNN